MAKVFSDSAVERISRAVKRVEAMAPGEATRRRRHAVRGSGSFPIKVEKTGGSDGTSSTAASWVYTARTIGWNGASGGVTLGTSKSPKKPRPNGLTTFQTGSVGYGVGFVDESGVFQIWDAGEVPTAGECT